jgi:hypothetical protein
MGIVNPIALLTFMQIPNGLMTISQDGQPTNVLIMAFMAYVDRIYIYISGLLTIKHMFGCKVQCLINDGWLMIATVLW